MLMYSSKGNNVSWEIEFSEEANNYPNAVKIYINGKYKSKYIITTPGLLIANVSLSGDYEGPPEAALRFAKAFTPTDDKRKIVGYLKAMIQS